MSDSSPTLWCEIRIELFAAVKRIPFEKYKEPDLKALLQHRARDRGIKVDVGRDLWIEPNHPEWFDDFEAEPLFLAFDALRFDDAAWRETFKSAFAGSTPSPANPPTIYCETNTSTEVIIGFDMRIKRSGKARHEMRDFGLTVSKNLAMLVLAFEGEIDKLLPDHRGYVTQSASALSNAYNSTLKTLTTKRKLHKLWACGSMTELVNMMCPGADTANYPDHEGFKSQYRYNFVPLLRSTKPSFQFRQHHGSLDAQEILYWVEFTANLVLLARQISEPDLLRLVHYEDKYPVNLIELFFMMISFQSLSPEMQAMMDFYSRKSMARGTNLKVPSKLRLPPEEASTGKYIWLELTESEEKWQ
ncbi:hypothetical protein MMC07_009605 [Pseudocyphellaria aurata]|nr:hypothetical protein [Pseudocyphellaria aurata]